MYVFFVYGCCRLKVVQVIGKRSRPVPILITQDMTESMDILLETRAAGGVLPSNAFFFALPGSAAHLQFYRVLRRVAVSAKLKRPDLLTTTRMRKHLATMAQVWFVQIGSECMKFLIVWCASLHCSAFYMLLCCARCLQCFDAVGWAAGRASGL